MTFGAELSNESRSFVWKGVFELFCSSLFVFTWIIVLMIDVVVVLITWWKNFLLNSIAVLPAGSLLFTSGLFVV